jgi:hypothetical protein
MSIFCTVRVSAVVVARRCMLCGCRRGVQGLELDVVLAKQALVVPEAVQQLSFRKPAAPLARDERSGHALSAGPDAVFAGKYAIALDLALLTLHAGKDPPRLRLRSGSGSLLLCGSMPRL